MAIQQGDRVPAGTFKIMTAEGPKALSTDDIFAGRTVVLFAVPGAFTPTCSARHLPGFVDQAAAIKAKGVDTIACLSVNDVFVMDAWGKVAQVGDKVLMLADGSADYAEALGLTLDLRAAGLGVRAQRFAMIVRDGVVDHLAIEAAGAFDVSSAEAILSKL